MTHGKCPVKVNITRGVLSFISSSEKPCKVGFSSQILVKLREGRRPM